MKESLPQKGTSAQKAIGDLSGTIGLELHISSGEERGKQAPQAERKGSAVSRSGIAACHKK
jgi:hypothetical protein